MTFLLLGNESGNTTRVRESSKDLRFTNGEGEVAILGRFCEAGIELD
jgi:hypothetical protein